MAIDYDILKNIRKKHQYSYEEMACILGISERAYRSYEFGERDMSTNMILKFCKTFDVSADKLLGMEHSNPEIRKDIKIINGKIIYLTPIYDQASDYSLEPLDLIPECFNSLKAARSAIAIKASGDEMYPKIEDGDIVIVNKLEHGRHGDLVLLNANGKNMFRRKIRTREKESLEAFNPMLPPIDITDDKADEITIIGVVKRIIKNV